MSKTDKEVDALNCFQQNAQLPPLLCDMSGASCVCMGSPAAEGVMIATPSCWVCPCGLYTKNYR